MFFLSFMSSRVDGVKLDGDIFYLSHSEKQFSCSSRNVNHIF